jgi:hypothetical protein
VADEVRALRPDYAALLITADGLQPGPSDEASEEILAAAELRAPGRLVARLFHDGGPLPGRCQR